MTAAHNRAASPARSNMDTAVAMVAATMESSTSLPIALPSVGTTVEVTMGGTEGPLNRTEGCIN